MEFEWDEDKRRRNVEDHGFDFLDGVLVFAGEYYCRYSPRRGEDRWLAIRSVAGIRDRGGLHSSQASARRSPGSSA
jgi:uncharacterized DUF497 family protein